MSDNENSPDGTARPEPRSVALLDLLAQADGFVGDGIMPRLAARLASDSSWIPSASSSCSVASSVPRPPCGGE